MKQAWLITLLLLPLPVWAAGNLVRNGSFDDEADPLANWQSKYEAAGESWYKDNHQFVSVLKSESGRKSVLRLHVPTQFIADNPGVKVDSFPIPVQPGGKYRFSAFARSTGPNCRILLEGYKWRPDTKPQPNPTIYQLRKAYKFEQLFFGAVPGGVMGNVGPAWQRATTTLPTGAMKELQQKLYNSVQFLIIHVVAIGGTVGDLYVDDIVLERIN